MGRSRCRVGWREFSGRLINRLCCRQVTPTRTSRFAAAQLPRFSVMITRGTYWQPASSLRENFLAAAL
jgi:hypothetical protein